MIITDNDIRYAESILLDEGQYFDDERRIFIKNMETIDLQAVPGSGKTTALLAKLLIIETKLPLKDGSGILVLSHTNAAIDEIKQRIQKHCPKLFAYPNFVGTIQSFVNSFLALPYFVNHFKSRITRIDNEIYEEKVENKLNQIWNYRYKFDNDTFSKIKSLKHSNKGLFYNCRFGYINGRRVLLDKMNGKEFSVQRPKKNSKNYSDYDDETKINIKNWFIRFKTELISNDKILHFDDAYYLASSYLNTYSIGKIIHKRFGYIFIDEMQDMERHQVELIEELFYDECNCILQRIGDINQAIYSSGHTEGCCVWQPRDKSLTLTRSHRLSSNIANIVKKFALYTNESEIEGKNAISSLKPHILCYDDHTIHEVIPVFSNLIKNLKDNNQLPNFNRPIKAIAWNTDWKDDEDSRMDINKLRLEDFYLSYNKKTIRPKIDYQCLKEYLIFYDKRKQTLEPIRKNILNAFIKILRMENVKDKDNVFYTKRKLINYLRNEHPVFYDYYKLKVYQWCLGIVKGDLDEVWNDIKSFVPKLLAIFNKIASNSIGFMESDIIQNQLTDFNKSLKTSNVYSKDGFPIEIASVHSVKGQTHCATLYLESCYHDYESNKLKDVFLGADIDLNKARQIEASKMIYVGFSRPMDLLCFAIHKDRLGPMRDKLMEEWEIIDIFDKD